MRRVLALSIIVVCTVFLGACIDASRVNATCRWTDSSSAKLDLTQTGDREHLRQDVQIAWEVAQRYADVRYRTNPRMSGPLLDACRDAMDDSIASRHGVTLGAIARARYARTWSVDIALVFLPTILLTVVAMRLAARETQRSVKTEKTKMIVLPGAAILVALIAASIMQMWAMMLETFRLRNEHIAGRAFVLPSVAHRGIAFASLCVVAVIVAVVTMRQSSDTDRSVPLS